jgi:hypothetical protein
VNVASRKRKSLLDGGPARAGSWMALLAATTLGDGADMLRAEVKADGLADTGTYRLVVQSYDGPDGRTIPGLRERPRASVQRVVTAAELREGVRVPLVLLASTGEDERAPTVVAWVESGSADLEFDARAARPSRGSMYGVTKRGRNQGTIHISLNRKVAA